MMQSFDAIGGDPVTRPLTSDRRVWAAVVVVTFAIAFLPIAFGTPPIMGPDRIMPDPDAYMRLVWVEHWWTSAGWYEHLFPRSNAPFGETLHWTRPLDLILVVLAAPFRLFIEWRDAFYWAGVFLNPILMLGVLAGLGFAARPILGGGWVFLLLAVLVVKQPALHNYFLPARPDHHGLLGVLFALQLGLVLRFIWGWGRLREAFFAGAAAGVGVWVSVEGLVPAALFLSAFGLLWVWRGERWARFIQLYLLGATLAGGVGLVAESAPATWTLPLMDRISIVQVTLFAVLAAAFSIIVRIETKRRWTVLGRLVAGGMAAAIGIGWVSGLYPTFLDGPLAALDPRLVPVWFDKISEVRPLIDPSLTGMGKAVFLLGPAGLGVGWSLYQAAKPQQVLRHKKVAVFTVIMAMATIGLSLWQVRWSIYASIVVAIPWTQMLAVIWRWQGGLTLKDGRVLRMRAVVFLAALLPHIIIGSALMFAGRSNEDPSTNMAALASTCSWTGAARGIAATPEGRSGRALVVLANIHQGPEILYRTPHHVIATPYFRNHRAILETFDALKAENDAPAREMVQARKVDLLVFCEESLETKSILKAEQDHFLKRLMTGQVPDWLEPVPEVTAAASDFRAFRPR